MILVLCSLTVLHKVIVSFYFCISCIVGQVLYVARQCGQYLWGFVVQSGQYL